MTTISTSKGRLALSIVLAVAGFGALIAGVILVGAAGFIAGVGGIMLALGLVGVDLDDQERRGPR